MEPRGYNSDMTDDELGQANRDDAAKCDACGVELPHDVVRLCLSCIADFNAFGPQTTPAELGSRLLSLRPTFGHRS